MKHKLTQRQEEEKLSNKDMAKKLGLTEEEIDNDTKTNI